MVPEITLPVFMAYTVKGYRLRLCGTHSLGIQLSCKVTMLLGPIDLDNLWHGGERPSRRRVLVGEMFGKEDGE